MKAFELFVNIFMIAAAIIILGFASFLTYLLFVDICGKEIVDPAGILVVVLSYIVFTKIATEDYVNNIKDILSE